MCLMAFISDVLAVFFITSEREAGSVMASFVCTVEGKSKWYHKVFQGSFHLKRQAVPLNLTWVDLAVICTKVTQVRLSGTAYRFRWKLS